MAYSQQISENCAVSDLGAMLATERRRLEQERDELAAQIREATTRVSVIEARLQHVDALLDEGGDHPPIPPEMQSQKRDIADMAAEVLAERNGEPLYYKELAAEVIARGGEIGGASPSATLTARLVRDDRFVRPVRKGFYALRKDYPNAPNVGARKRQRAA